MCDSMKTPEEKAAEAFFGSKADAVHGLFFPPAPASNMALFRKRITQAIERQRVREGEAEKETAAERFRFIRDNPRLQDKEAGPPDTRAKVNWTWETVTDPDTGETLEGWLHDGLRPVCPVGILKDDPDADGPVERIARAYLDIALVHDRTDEHFQRGRLKLLDGFALPDEIDGENARCGAFMVGDYFPGMQEPGEERRRKIEQALADVKGDLDSHAADAAEHQGDKPTRHQRDLPHQTLGGMRVRAILRRIFLPDLLALPTTLANHEDRVGNPPGKQERPVDPADGPIDSHQPGEDGGANHQRHVPPHELLRHHQRRDQGGYSQDEQDVEDITPHHVPECQVRSPRQGRLHAHGKLWRARAIGYDGKADDERRQPDGARQTGRAAHQGLRADDEEDETYQQEKYRHGIHKFRT